MELENIKFGKEGFCSYPVFKLFNESEENFARIQDEYEMFACNLGLTEAEIESLGEKLLIGGMTSRGLLREMLRIWWNSHPEDANLEVLYQALLDVKLKDLAKKVKHKFQKVNMHVADRELANGRHIPLVRLSGSSGSSSNDPSASAVSPAYPPPEVASTSTAALPLTTRKSTGGGHPFPFGSLERLENGRQGTLLTGIGCEASGNPTQARTSSWSDDESSDDSLNEIPFTCVEIGRQGAGDVKTESNGQRSPALQITSVASLARENEHNSSGKRRKTQQSERGEGKQASGWTNRLAVGVSRHPKTKRTDKDVLNRHLSTPSRKIDKISTSHPGRGRVTKPGIKTGSGAAAGHRTSRRRSITHADPRSVHGGSRMNAAHAVGAVDRSFPEAPVKSMERKPKWKGFTYPIQKVYYHECVDKNDGKEDFCGICLIWDGKGKSIIASCDLCTKSFHKECHMPVISQETFDSDEPWICNFHKSKWDMEAEIRAMDTSPGGEEDTLNEANVKVFTWACKFMLEVYKIPEIPTMKWEFPQEYKKRFGKVPYHLKFLREKLCLPGKYGNVEPFSSVEEYMGAFKQMFEQAFRIYVSGQNFHNHAVACLDKIQVACSGLLSWLFAQLS